MRQTNSEGRKKLVPRLDLETKCPHSFTEEDVLQLEVDCEDCPGAQDLVNPRCVAGVLQIVSSEAVPAAIILKRHLHKRYRGARVSGIADAATCLSVLNRAVRPAGKPSDTRCRTCGVSERNLALALRGELLEDPHRFMTGMDDALERVGRDAAPHGCRDAPECLRRMSNLLHGKEEL